MQESSERKDGDVKAGISANVYGAKFAIDAIFEVDPVEPESPQTLRELFHLLKLNLYVFILRLVSVPTALLTAVERFSRGSFRPKVPVERLIVRQIVVVDEDQGEIEPKLLEGQPELKKLPPP